MNIKFDHAKLSLDKEHLLRLHECKGMRVQCNKGSLWVTQDSDATDYVLGPGQVLELEHGGDAIVFALMQSDLTLSEPAREPSPLDRFGSGLLQVLEALGGWIAERFGPQAISSRRLRGWYGAL